MIYDPITRQVVTLVGRCPVQKHCFKFGKRQQGEFRFVQVRYGEQLPGFKGGFPVGEVRDSDLNYLVADDGAREIHSVYDALPEIPDAQK